MNDLYLTDEDIHALDEPTWEEQEIERLKKEKEQIENKLENKKCIIEMAINYIDKHPVNACHDLLSILLLGDNE